MAANRFFGVQELVEMVQLQLPPVDIIVSKRASRAFRDSYDKSVKLKKIVRPAKEPEEKWIKQVVKERSSYMYIRRPQPLGGFVINGPGPVDGVVPNPIIFKESKLGRCIGYKRVGDRAIAMLDLSKVVPESSCNDLFLTQPPVKSVGYVHSTLECYEDGCAVFNSAGITVGDIFKECGPSPRVTVDLGNVKIMEEEFMEKMRANGRFVNNWRELLIGDGVPGQRLRELLDQESTARLAAVSFPLLLAFNPELAKSVFPLKI
ncbi:hypothetical protein PRZ48_008785 [Zasmidium cellare]|uniref:Uncharacterized protein n=1 Tax=Zasmidium cellare TaxID=395010 RepID=A0ABR0EGG3_ZASCE|nr:hypothetical protein PRZ48_008785 [Zasmidium cellare]